MKTQYFSFGILAALILGLTTCLVGCQEDVNAVVRYMGKVVYLGTTKPFQDLEVKVTNGEKIHCITHTDETGSFSFDVKVDEIDGNYYLLIGDSTCVTKRMQLSGYGQAQVDLGTIEIEGPSLPIVTTKSVTNVADNKATCGGNVTSDGRSSVTARGVCWSKSEYPTLNDEYTVNGSGLGEFKSQITDLEPGTEYYIRAYATNRMGTAYGEQVTLSTATGLPSVITAEVTDISATTATCGGDVAANSGYPITARGICWSSNTASPTISNDHTEEVATTGTFTSIMVGLERNTTYYVRAYAVNEKGTGYGATKIFTTLSGIPTVTTAEVTEIKTTSAIGGGDVTSNGGFPITGRGICWSSISSTPTVEDSHTNEVANMGPFSSLMTGLEAHTTYYVRAYATNEVGTAYGTSVVFTSGNGLPIVETLDPGENITSSSISAVGNVLDDGGFEVTVRGFVYSTLPYPTLTNGSNITSGSGLGYFSANITGISPKINTYYIRAYATNALGTTYGEQVVITTERSEYLSLKKMTYGGYTYRIKFIGKMSWTEGNTACSNLVFGGYNDWFMPDDAEVQAILTAYDLWDREVSGSDYSPLLMDGCSSIWTSVSSSSHTTYYHIVDIGGGSSYLWKWALSRSTASKSTIRGVYAVRKYRAENY